MTKLSAWFAAWKWVLILVLLVIASGWLNVLQWGWRQAAKAEARAETLADTLQTTADIAKQAQSDNTELMASLSEIADRGQRIRFVYRDAAKSKPLAPECAPGQQRIDVINQALGPQQKN